MARTETKWVYTFAELDCDAKEKAREWWRSHSDATELDGVTDWLAEVCGALAIDLDSRKVYWRGFWSQGDGSSYAGAVDAWKLAKAIDGGAWRGYVGNLELPAAPSLHRLVRELLDNGTATVTASCGESRGYGGEFNLRTDSEWECYGLDDLRHARIAAALVDLGEWAESVLDAINDWFYRALESEYEYQNSDEVIDETMAANEYEFDINGSPA